MPSQAGAQVRGACGWLGRLASAVPIHLREDGVCGQAARRSRAGHPVGMRSFVAKEPRAEVPEPPPDLPPLEPEGPPEEEPEPDEVPEPRREPEEEPVPA
jgi:hypothetical protein